MRVFAAVLLGMSIMASPLLANDATETGKENLPAAVTPAAAVQPGNRALPGARENAEPAKTENSAIESEVQDLRNLVEEQRAELESQRAALKALEEKLGTTPTPSEPATVPAVSADPSLTSPATSAGRSPAAIGSATRSLSLSRTPPQGEQVSPLYFKIGAAEFYPLGFMDAMNVFRTTTTGTGISTSFNSVPQNNTILGRDSEDRFSIQNSRIGLRTHAKFGEADVTGYLEADFLGFQPPNANDTSNSNTLRMRLYWVDYKRGMWEILGGQSWSMMTPNRVGLSPMPGDIFYSQDVDTNYQLGLTWARTASLRLIAHPNKNWAIGLALENPQQTLVGGVTLPANISSQTNYGSQFDTNSGSLTGTGVATNTAVPNLHPDVIVKTAFDATPGGHAVHFDFAGLFRTFDAVNLVASGTSNLTNANTVKTSAHGGGVAGTMNVELVKNLRVIATAFYGTGGGRYIASTGGPDIVIRPDGTIAGVKSGSGIGGFEYQPEPNTLIYGYYSGAYFARTAYALTSGGTTTFSGYGQPGSGNSANRYLYEPTFGIHHYLWRNANYGDIRLMTQVSYVSRSTWVVSPPSLLPTAHNVMVYLDLRYDLP